MRSKMRDGKYWKVRSKAEMVTRRLNKNGMINFTEKLKEAKLR
jgi:hypothetical protein